MNDQVIEIIIARMDRMENKIDQLLEFKWKAAGIMFVLLAAGNILAKKLGF